MQAQIETWFDQDTATFTHLVYDQMHGHAAIIDPVLTYQAHTGHLLTSGLEALLSRVRDLGVQLDWILETHAHAEHLTAAAYIKQQLGGKIAIGESICQVQAVFKQTLNLGADFAADGSQFDYLFKDNEYFQLGQLRMQALWVPGHTPADMAYLVGDALFVGDTLFMPDVGTARCDFPGGDARTLYRSIQRLLAFAPETELYLCHDYPPVGREPAWLSQVAEQRRHNIHVHDGVTEADFIRLREARDQSLELPRLMLPAMQLNIRAGYLPEPEPNGVSYFKTPLTWS